MAQVYGRTNTVVARLPGVKAAVREQRDEIHERAEALFAAHDRPGRHQLTKANRDPDALVVLEGPAPLSVEFGRAGYTTADGARVGPVEGLHILGKAADL